MGIPVEMELKQCPFGCSGSDEFLFLGADRLYGQPGEFRVVRCRVCGLIRINPRPTPETIGFYYPDNYGPYQESEAFGAERKKEIIPLWKRIFRSVVRFNTICLPPLTPGRMLEIGCAAGGFMHRMACAGWGVEGIEFSSSAAKKASAKGFAVECISLEQATPPLQQYDIVVGWMVIEHLHDPLTALRKLADWIRPGGWLVISVPNAESFEARLFKDSWYALHLPAHLYHFSPRTLGNLLKCGGWQVERIFHQRILTSLIGSIGLLLHKKGWLPRVASALVRFPEESGRWNVALFPLAYLLSHFGQTGRMTVWARKSDD
jgi:SAM-dependent methyltransferase